MTPPIVTVGRGYCHALGKPPEQFIYFAADRPGTGRLQPSRFTGDLCRAIVLKEVPAIENPASMLARGDYDTGITQYRVDKFYGTTSFVHTEGIVIRPMSKFADRRLRHCDY